MLIMIQRIFLSIKEVYKIMSKIYIKINDQEISWTHSFITPKNILEMGKVQEPYNVYIIVKIQDNKDVEIWDATKDLQKEIEVTNGDQFNIVNIKNRKIHYTVNGENQETLYSNNELTVKEILERAKFIPVEKFKLFNIKIDKDYIDKNEKIKIQNGDEFLALSSGPTPVANQWKT